MPTMFRLLLERYTPLHHFLGCFVSCAFLFPLFSCLLRCAAFSTSPCRSPSGARMHSRGLLQRRINLHVAKDSALDTRHVPLERIFNGEREYLFTTKRNVRSYEWRTDEVEDLFESMLALGDDSDALELNAITIMKTEIGTKFKDVGKTSQFYDVYDGQQRLVSLCLLLAALRDNLIEWGADYSGDAMEVAKTVYPSKRRHDPVPRIQLREKDGRLLNAILGKGAGGEHSSDFTVPKPRARRNLSGPEQCIIEVYEYFLKRVQDLGPVRALELLDNLMSCVYLLICVPSETRIARNIVSGLGKGKNVEPVDEFKGIVCFNTIDDETLQDNTLVRWNELCDEVGRNTLQSSCLLFAQIWLRKRVRKNCEVDLMEEFLKKYIAKHRSGGVHFFERKVIPAAKTLSRFRDGHISLVGDGDVPSIGFLRAASQITTSKEIEMAVLDILIRWQFASDDIQKLALEHDLKMLEHIALWMMLTKPKPAIRIKRCIDIIHTNDETSRLVDPLELTREEKKSMRSILDEFEFGGSPSGTKVAKALLERINEFELVRSNQGRIQPMKSTLQLEHVLPQKFDAVDGWSHWDPDGASDWIHRLGNLALVNQKINGRIGNGPFAEKRGHLATSPYPLTRTVSRYEMWDAESVRGHHNDVLRLATEVWDI